MTKLGKWKISRPQLTTFVQIVYGELTKSSSPDLLFLQTRDMYVHTFIDQGQLIYGYRVPSSDLTFVSKHRRYLYFR